MSKKIAAFIGALSMSAILLPTAALADDPRDPGMRNADALARDRAMTKRLNEGQLAYVRQRDGKTLRTYRQTQSAHDSAYADANAEYSRKMAAWRRAVAACNAGNRAACDN